MNCSNIYIVELQQSLSIDNYIFLKSLNVHNVLTQVVVYVLDYFKVVRIDYRQLKNNNLNLNQRSSRFD